MKKLLVSVASVTVLAVCAEDFYIKNGATDWTSADSFTADAAGAIAATRAPGDGAAQADAVFIPSGYTAYVEDKASLDRINNLDRIRPMSETAILVITVPEGACWTNTCPFNYDGASRATYQHYGKMLKRGAGDLELITASRYTNGSGYNTDYCSSLFAEEGTLILPQQPPNSRVFYAFELGVGANATLVTCIGISTYPCLVSGSGTITNRASSAQPLYIIGASSNSSLNIAALREFSGVIAGPVALTSAARLYLTGTNNTFNSGVAACNNANRGLRWNGILGVSKFGKKGQPSSLGLNNSMSLGYSTDCPGGVVQMLGAEEETTDRNFIYYVQGVAPTIFDACAFGGVTFEGNITRPDLSKTTPKTFLNAVLVWTGSNTVHECAYRGPLIAQANGGTNYMVHLVKRGTGIWHLADQTKGITRMANDRRMGLSGVTVEEGTFRFDSITRKGDVCSLGTGTSTTEAYQGYHDPSKVVDWTFALGTATTEGTLEYTGTNSANAYTRPIVLRGDARLVNSTNSYVRYLALSPEGAGAKTLTLDGSNTLDNEISDVTDTAAAPVSIVKKGGGKWILGGNLTFHGDIDVQGGELVVRKYPQKYSWFKWLIKENSITERCPTASEIVQSHVFALYDKDLVCHTIGLQEVTNAACVLQPGQATFEANRFYKEQHATYRPMGNLFLDYQGGYGMYVIPYKADNSGALRPTRANPDSWMPIVMRMTNGAPEIVGWDYVLAYGAAQDGSNRSVCGYTIEGSVDGMHWDDLTGDIFHPSNTLPTVNTKWVSGGTANKAFVTGDAARHTSNGSAFALPEAFKFTRTTPDAFTVLNNVGQVKVAAGAKLTADGEDVTLSSLAVDAAGAGTVDGFAFAARGTLEVTGLSASGQAFELPLTVVNATGLENVAGWSLTRDGVADTSRWIAVHGNTITICPKGTALYLR